MKKIILFLILMTLAGCMSAELKKGNTQIANPASVYCEKQNGTLNIITAADGSQSGTCTLKDGTECNEWAYYRGECPKKEQKEEVIQEEKPILKTIPESIERNCIGFVIGAPDETALIAKIGGAWARPHPGPFAWGFIETSKGNFDFSMTDDYVKNAQNNNVAILGTIWPFADWDQKQCHDTSCEVSERDIFYPREKMGWKEGIPKSRCSPCNYEDYKNFVAKLADRYNGDGINDMPGLIIPIKYWEVLNEPEMKNNDMTFFKGSKDDYVMIFSKTREAIKQACPDCKVLHGGMAGIEQFMIDYWADILNKIDFDVANIHYIGSRDLSSLNVKDFKKLVPGKPIWVTEAQHRSDSEVAASVEGALNAGASKIFFTQFKIGQFGLPPDGKYSEGYNNIAAKCR